LLTVENISDIIILVVFKFKIMVI